VTSIPPSSTELPDGFAYTSDIYGNYKNYSYFPFTVDGNSERVKTRNDAKFQNITRKEDECLLVKRPCSF